MRGTFVTILAAGGLLALGAWTTPGQSTEPAQADGQRAGAACASAEASHARDEGIRRTHTRPRASSVRPSADAHCAPSVVRRDAQRARRNAAIDRTLNRGE